MVLLLHGAYLGTSLGTITHFFFHFLTARNVLRIWRPGWQTRGFAR